MIFLLALIFYSKMNFLLALIFTPKMIFMLHSVTLQIKLIWLFITLWDLQNNFKQ